MKGDTEIKWINIENELATGSIGESQKQQLHLFRIGNTVRNWRRLCKKCKIQSKNVQLREMLHDPDFIPNRSDKILQYWAGKGLISFSQFLTENTINTCEAMTSRYGQKHFFKYLQISYIKKNSEEEKKENELLQYLVQ